jgi:hypothetical protein
MPASCPASGGGGGQGLRMVAVLAGEWGTAREAGHRTTWFRARWDAV